MYQMLKFGVFNMWQSSEMCKEALRKESLKSVNDLVGDSLM